MTEVLTGDPLGWRLAHAVSTAIAIGVFDGVHRGHQRVLKALVDEAERRRLAPTVLTFDPHPLELVDPERAPRLLSTVGQRIDAFGRLGFEIVGVLPFDQIRRLPAEVFAKDILGDRLSARLVAVGEDFRFGVDRSGDVETLAATGFEVGYDVEVVQLLDADDAPISSSRIRRLIAEGKVDRAAAMLGDHYELGGIVVEGDGRGRTIGFPTANLAIDHRMAVPADGVYAAWVHVGAGTHPAVVNVGVRPTFDGQDRTVEAHLLDGDHDLYGRHLGIRFVQRLRGEQKFAGVDELVVQIGRDATKAATTLGFRRARPPDNL